MGLRQPHPLVAAQDPGDPVDHETAVLQDRPQAFAVERVELVEGALHPGPGQLPREEVPRVRRDPGGLHLEQPPLAVRILAQDLGGPENLRVHLDDLAGHRRQHRDGHAIDHEAPPLVPLRQPGADGGQVDRVDLPDELLREVVQPDDADGARLRPEPAVSLVVEEPLGDAEPGDVLRRDRRGCPSLAGPVHVAAEEHEGREERDDDQILDPLRGVDVDEPDAFHGDLLRVSGNISGSRSAGSLRPSFP